MVAPEPRKGRKDEEGGGALDRLADAIASDTPVDWVDAEREHPDLADELAGLRLLEQIAIVHRSAPPVPGATAREAGADRPILFMWGSLRVVGKIGEGTTASVWRAYDARLQRYVALKLLHEHLADGGLVVQGFLEEARRMARVRHPNVLTIHGVDQHDGRAGFWADLVDGATLEERLRTGGPFGAGEAAVAGAELCRALAAVHASGIVHGDIKASNVMRDRQGKIVLMDFGAGSERPAGADGAGIPPRFGTPLALAPEVFAGAPAGVATDVYALGVLLFRLVSGRYPVEADAIVDLEARHRRGERASLFDLRPDLPSDWIAIIDRAIDPDPAKRFRSMGEMEGALMRFLAADAPGRPASVTATPASVHGTAAARGSLPSARRWIPVAVGVLVLAIAAFGIAERQRLQRSRLADRGNAASEAPAIATLPAEPAPRTDAPLPSAAPLSVEATLCRSRGGAKEVLAPGALVRTGDALFLELQASEPVHAYVLNEDAAGNVVLVFPIPDVDRGNPIGPAGQTHRLPGSRAGVALDWQMSGPAGEEGFLLIASREPVEGLAALIPDRSDAETGGSRLKASAQDDTRGITGTVAAPPAGEGAAASALSGIARRIADSCRTPGGIWIRQFAVYNAGL